MISSKTGSLRLLGTRDQGDVVRLGESVVRSGMTVRLKAGREEYRD